MALWFGEDQMNWNVPGNSHEIPMIVVDYAFAKLCSALDVGIKVGSQ